LADDATTMPARPASNQWRQVTEVSVFAGGVCGGLTVPVRTGASGTTAASAVPTAVPVRVRFADQLCLPSFKTVIPPPQAPEVSSTILLPLVGVVFGGGTLAVVRRRRRVSAPG